MCHFNKSKQRYAKSRFVEKYEKFEHLTFEACENFKLFEKF